MSDQMLDFDVDLTQPKAKSKPVLTETVTVRAIPTQSTAHVAVDASDWNWSDLRDYIVAEIEQRHGVQVRDPKKEASVIKSFMSRWGTDKAVAIARAAFDVHDGMWRNAPISINRFCKASDPFFAEPIATNL